MPKANFYCVGAAHIDVKARALECPRLDDSVPVTTKAYIGGVACNVAQNLAHTGAEVALCSLVGKDAQGHALRLVLKSSGIIMTDVGLSHSAPTAKYYALIKDNGELFIATSDMAIYDELSPEFMMPIILQRSEYSDWIIDANIPAVTIKIIAQKLRPEQRLWGVGVSSYKTARLAQALKRYEGLVLNMKELGSLSKKRDVKDAMQHLIKEGCSRLIVTAGASGVYYCEGPQIIHKPCPALRVVDVTGAGDAFSAGAIYALANLDTLEQAVDLGLSFAAKALLIPESSMPALFL